MSKPKLSTESYKGVRDFYPEDQFVQRYLFEHMERVCELYGYEEYSASVLEPAELYRAKTSDEIVNEQTYTFTDRGGREVTLRPEMTPTVARLVAARAREMQFPARLYSIPNLFRYERPQRGRLREHWQLNVDLLGADGVEADAEIIAVAHDIMRSFGAETHDFEIRVSDRRILDSIYDSVGIAKEYAADVTRLLDRRSKLDDFEKRLTDLIAHEEKAVRLIEDLERVTSTAYLEELRVTLEHLGVRNMIVDTTITRGF
ncbi:MAG TPA: ATP phosphoribosyltransferase regulatory subunit, partial [Candidatus Paceibacterota bacterium]